MCLPGAWTVCETVMHDDGVICEQGEWRKGMEKTKWKPSIDQGPFQD